MQQTTVKTRRIAAIVAAAPAEPTVSVVGFVHHVDFGPGVRPRLHVVSGGACNCAEDDCPAPAVVVDWLAAGRIPPVNAPTGYTPYLPKSCPVCGAPVAADHSLSSRNRGLGWRCAVGGAGHYLADKFSAVKGWFYRDELLPGVRRADIPAHAPMGYLPECNRWAEGSAA